MKIDELIEELEKVKEEHGNLEVDITKNYNYKVDERIFTTNENKKEYETICWISL